MSQLAIILLPVLTGLCSVYWAKLVDRSWALAPLSNIVGYGLLLALLLLMRKDTPAGLAALLRQPSVMTNFALQSGLTVLISLAWMISLDNAPLAAIGFVEISYPLFILLFSALLIGGMRFLPLHWVGCVLIVLGTVAVVAANIQAKRAGG